LRLSLTYLIGLCIPLLAHAEYSRTYLESYPLRMAAVGELDIAYRIVEPGPGKPKAVVIMGLGGSNVAWGDALISGLANGGYEILLLDNRDSGASTRFDEWGQPILWW
jgi:pimeloyl-ACP methyl ester carboxylesterase